MTSRIRAARCLVLVLVLLGPSCPGRRSRGNVVLVTIESLRADRLLGRPPAVDPLTNLRALAPPGSVRKVLASSSETLPSLATLFTGETPAKHGTLVEGLDRLPGAPPTVATLLGREGFRTAGFPSLVRLGIGSGLSRGFDTYGWPPGDLLLHESTTGTDLQGWVLEAGRRTGEGTVADALRWVEGHASSPFFLWVHLSDAAHPYASEGHLIEVFRDSPYDAALAYDDRCFRALFDGIARAGLGERTTFVVAGDHGESLGENGESFHGLNLYPAALATVIAIIPPKGGDGGTVDDAKEPVAEDRESGPVAASGEGGGPKGPGRLQDLFATLLGLAGVPLPGGSQAKPGLPPIGSDTPLFAATLGPRSSFGWGARIALFEGDWVWTGPGEDEELQRLAESGLGARNWMAEEPDRARRLRDRGLAQAAPIANRLEGRPGAPSAAKGQQILALLRTAGRARESNPGGPEEARAALRKAWDLDPGNFETARWLVRADGPGAAPENAALVREVETRGGDLPEGALGLATVLELAGDGFEQRAQEAMKRACGFGGAACAVDLAIRLGRSGHHEEAAAGLFAVAERENDPDLWRAVGDLRLAANQVLGAMVVYQKAEKLRPDDPDLLLRQGDCLMASGDLDVARARYEAASSLSEGSPVVELRLGKLSRQTGDRRGALKHFRQAMGEALESPEGKTALGELLIGVEMNQEAIPVLIEAADQDIRSVAAPYLAAKALAAVGRLDEAEKSLQQALARNPEDRACLLQHARILVQLGRRAEGGRALEQLAQVASPDVAKAALSDPLFTNDAPEAPLQRGMRALADAAKRLPAPAAPGGQGPPTAGSSQDPPGRGLLERGASEPPSAREPVPKTSRP